MDLVLQEYSFILFFSKKMPVIQTENSIDFSRAAIKDKKRIIIDLTNKAN